MSLIECACTGCMAAASASDSATIGAIAKATSFQPFFCNEDVLWICPACWPRLFPAFELLDGMLGRRAAYEPIEFLVRRWKEATAGAEKKT